MSAEAEPNEGTVPRILLLGPPLVEGAGGPEPTAYAAGRTVASHTARATELVAYLVLHPRGATTAELSAVHSPRVLRSPATLHSLVSRLRRWLGHDERGRPWLPRASSGGRLVLDARVHSDWDLWRGLVTADPTTAPTDDLEAAVRLVQGQPLTGTPPGRWGWADDIRQQMIDSIATVGHELAGRHLETGDLTGARRITAFARTVDPANELIWRDALTTELRAGDVDAQRRLIAQLVSIVDDRCDLDPETARLISSA